MTTQLAEGTATPAHIHPPKLESFGLATMTNTDAKGIVRPVQEYRITPAGLYMSRPATGHAGFTHIESWVLPSIGLRVSRFDWVPDFATPSDFYIDVATVHINDHEWQTTDLYLDLKVWTGQRTAVLDTDELLMAIRAGFVDDATAEWALNTGYRAVDGLARYGYDTNRWLASEGLEINWRARPDQHRQD